MKKTSFILTAALALIATLPLYACSEPETAKTNEYEINVTYDEQTATVDGSCSLTYYNRTENEIDALYFNLWGNAYRQNAKYKPVAKKDEKAFYQGKSYGEEKINSVEGGASWKVCGEDENLLTVELSEPLYPDSCVTITIEYTLCLAKINHRTGITESTVNLGNFYPVACAYAKEGFIQTPYYSTGDPFVSECANYDVTIALPQGYAAATSGKEVERKEDKEGTRIRYTLENARDFAAVLSDRFNTLKKNSNGCTVTAYYCGEEVPQTEFNAACESLEYFCETFGQYPYPTYSVVFTPLNTGGMEYPALAMINSSLSESEGAYTAVHETAHQWWYATVGNDQVNAAWQDEGLAEYSSLCFFETHPAYGYTRTGLLGSAIKSYRAYYSVYNQIFNDSDTTMTRPLNKYAGNYEYVNVAYNKSLLMFESVRTAIGDAKFFKALKNYYKAQSFKIAAPEDLIAEFCALHDAEGLIYGYLDGKVVI